MLSYIVPFIFLILVVVFIHEYGHYYFARKYGVGVTDFSIGFGQELFGWNDKHGTRWKICWIPLGGYVKMLDERVEAAPGHAAASPEPQRPTFVAALEDADAAARRAMRVATVRNMCLSVSVRVSCETWTTNFSRRRDRGFRLRARRAPGIRGAVV